VKKENHKKGVSKMQIPFIDLKAQYKVLKNSIDQRIQKVLDHGAFINGPEVAELEQALQKFTGAPFALVCSNGTDALLMPLMALGIGPGDEVITTAFSFIATAEVIVLAGAKPVYVDIDPATFNINTSLIEKHITSKTKAIMPVSLYGQICDMDEINAIAKKHGLHVIEDAAQSFGALYKGKRSCNTSLMAGTSFFPAKPLGCYGDGGAVFTEDKNLYTAMKEIREHGSEKRYYHTRIGLNARLDSIQCAILLAKLERYQWELEQRDRIGKKFNEAFHGLDKKGLIAPFIKADRTSAWAQYTLRANKRDELQKRLTELGVPTSIHYPMIMPDQPAYKKLAGDTSLLTESRKAAQEVLSIPIYPDMSEEIMNTIIKKVTEAV
jgi:UDP-2-acetamido-2-deoxy-ribo-hexuluronate aminotransferase